MVDRVFQLVVSGKDMDLIKNVLLRLGMVDDCSQNELLIESDDSSDDPDKDEVWIAELAAMDEEASLAQGLMALINLLDAPGATRFFVGPRAEFLAALSDFLVRNEKRLIEVLKRQGVRLDEENPQELANRIGEHLLAKLERERSSPDRG